MILDFWVAIYVLVFISAREIDAGGIRS